LYAWYRHEVSYCSFRQQTAWIKAFQRAGFSDIATIEALDVGCYTGQWLRMLLEWGANPSKLHGVDILEESIAIARKLSPTMVDLRVSNGWPLPYSDDSMNLCAASTVFSSILVKNAREYLANEMGRVVRADGWVMVFDFAVSDPRNPDTTGINRHEIGKLFPALNLVETYRLILAPPLLRRFPSNLLWLAHAFEAIFPFLCTHRLYLLSK
jgi:ubiquinone/menaquinone biosynthesis C-methylase UbiE